MTIKIKYQILFLLILGFRSIFAQNGDNIQILQNGYSTNLYNSQLIKEIVIKQKLFKRSYNQLIQQAIDSSNVYNADILKITLFIPSNEVIHNQEILNAELYKVDSLYKDTIYFRIDSINSELESRRSFFHRMLGTYPAKKTINTKKKSLVDKIRSVESDSIKKGYIDIGGGVGFEYFALLYNANVSADLYFIGLKNTKVSISNRTGFYAGILPGVIIYTFPSIKYQQNISNFWLSLSFGREYGKIKSGFESNNKKYQLDYRFDLGLKIYDKSRSSVEFYIPIRISDEFPWYFTGISMNYYFRL